LKPRQQSSLALDVYNAFTYDRYLIFTGEVGYILKVLYEIVQYNILYITPLLTTIQTEAEPG